MKRAVLLLTVLAIFNVIGSFAQTSTDLPVGPGTRFYIQSAMNFGKNNGGYWDVPGVFQPNMSIP